ncbi:MAG: hypothetical protein KF764_26105 [Labilithrix sp.]|nr:hypothetical protein [Labilithrix sp.]MBX3221232.1 hypothetical protein [Labilithrix sp.]
MRRNFVLRRPTHPPRDVEPEALDRWVQRPHWDVALAAAGALVGLGAALLHSFAFVRGFILYPFP